MAGYGVGWCEGMRAVRGGRFGLDEERPGVA